MSTPPLQCPHCGVAMRAVTAEARSGYLLVLDQCAQCGGIWCDRWELFPLSVPEAARLDPVDETRLGAPTSPPTGPGRCPRCAVPLREFRDRLLPPDARIERCRVCDGMWLNRGTLHRLKRRSASSTPVRREVIERLVRAYGKEAKWATVKNIDAALQPPHDAARDADDIRSTVWSAVASIALRVLWRLLLGA